MIPEQLWESFPYLSVLPQLLFVSTSGLGNLALGTVISVISGKFGIVFMGWRVPRWSPLVLVVVAVYSPSESRR